MPVVGSVVRIVWTILGENGDPLTGQTSPTHVTFRLHRSTITGSVASGETVTMVEIGTTGTYEITYTPLTTGLYTLQLREIGPLTTGQQYRFPTDVFAAGSEATPNFADSFCSESDVERWAQLDFDPTTDPSDSDAALFAAGRAKEMQSIFAAAGFTVSPTDTLGDPQLTVLRECNAIGAAADCWLAKNLETQPGQSAHVRELLDEYALRLERATLFAQKVLGTNFINTPMTSGEVTLRDESSITDAGLSVTVGMEDEF